MYIIDIYESKDNTGCIGPIYALKTIGEDGNLLPENALSDSVKALFDHAREDIDHIYVFHLPERADKRMMWKLLKEHDMPDNIVLANEWVMG